MAVLVVVAVPVVAVVIWESGREGVGLCIHGDEEGGTSAVTVTQQGWWRPWATLRPGPGSFSSPVTKCPVDVLLLLRWQLS